MSCCWQSCELQPVAFRLAAEPSRRPPFSHSLPSPPSPSPSARPAVYYIGIIDVLQTWDFTKRMENWFKTSILRRDAEGVSAIPPGAYAERFRNRVLAQLIEGYETPR